MADSERWRKAKQATVSGVAVTSAYNFIEPPEIVPLTPWSSDEGLKSPDGNPSHSVPFAKAITGSLTLRWIFDQHFLIGGREGETNADGQQVHTHIRYNDKLVIPATSIRGMLRNVLEIIGASRVCHVDREARFAYRDRSRNGVSVLTRIWNDAVHRPKSHENPPRMKGGLLVPPKGFPLNLDNMIRMPIKDWTLIPAELARIDQQEASQVLTGGGLPKDAQWKETSIFDRYQHIDGANGERVCSEIKCQVAKRANYGHGVRWDQANPVEVAVNLHPLVSNSKVALGRVGLIGYAPEPDDDDDALPNTSWLFVHSYHDNTPVEVPENVMKSFISGHCGQSGGRNAMDFWYEKLCALQDEPAETFRRAIPVVWIENEVTHEPEIISLTRFMKVPHKYSVGEMAASGGQAWRIDWGGRLDLVQALLGHVPGDDMESDSECPQTQSWKSRIFFRHAELDGKAPDPRDVKKVVGTAGAPRASFSPFYLRQKEQGNNGQLHWSAPGVQLAGRKRYPVRGGDPRKFPNEDTQGTDSTRSEMHFLPPASFSGPLKLHNVHPVELGAVLWALGFGHQIWDGGEGSEYRHAMGRGKPQGYGRLEVKVNEFKLETGMGTELTSADLDNCKTQFETWLVNQLSETDKAEKIVELRHIQEFLAMSDPEIGRELGKRLDYPGSEALAGQGNDAEGAGPSVAAHMAIKEAGLAPNGPGDAVLWPYPRNRSKS